jgi:hypothetical protein
MLTNALLVVLWLAARPSARLTVAALSPQRGAPTLTTAHGAPPGVSTEQCFSIYLPIAMARGQPARLPTPTLSAPTGAPTAIATPSVSATAWPTLSSTATPTASRTASPTVTPHAPACAPPGQPFVFEDDFSNPATGWPVEDGPLGGLGYMEGEYRVRLNQAAPAVGVPAPVCALHDVLLQVDGRAIPGATFAYGLAFGVAFGDSAPEMYALVVRTDSQAALLKMQADWTYLVPWTPFAAGSPYDRLRVERRAQSIRALVNGRLIAAVNDDALSGARQVGLVVSAMGAAPVEARFDNYRLERLDDLAGEPAPIDRPQLLLPGGPFRSRASLWPAADPLCHP